MRVIANPAVADESLASDAGESCTVKDCCVVICEAPKTPNAPRLYTDQKRLTAAYDAVRGATEQLHGWTYAELVHRTLVKLPVRYNARLTRAIGRAKFRHEQGSVMATEIELTAAYEIPEDYMHGLLVHEGCHVARCIIEPDRFRYESPHGMEWSALMVAAGEEPKATCVDPRIAAQSRARKGHPVVPIALSELHPGDRVSFLAGKRGRVVGTVLNKAERTVTVKGDNGSQWRVAYELLTKDKP